MHEVPSSTQCRSHKPSMPGVLRLGTCALAQENHISEYGLPVNLLSVGWKFGNYSQLCSGFAPVVFRAPCSAGGQTELRHVQASALTLYSSLDTPWCTPDLLLGARGCAAGAVLLACAQPVSSAAQPPALGEETAAPTTPDAAASTEGGGDVKGRMGKGKGIG